MLNNYHCITVNNDCMRIRSSTMFEICSVNHLLYHTATNWLKCYPYWKFF